MRVKDYNHHHLCPKSRGGTWQPDNIVLLEIRTHNALHACFENDLPHEQLFRILLLNKTALREKFHDQVMDVIENGIGYAYKDGVLRPK